MTTTNILNNTTNTENQKTNEQLIKEYDERQQLIDDINKYHGTSKEPNIDPAKAIGMAIKHLITPNPHLKLQSDEETQKMIAAMKKRENAAASKNLSKEHADIAERFKVYAPSSINTLAELTEAIGAKEICVSDSSIKVIDKDGKETEFLTTDRVFGGTAKWVVVPVKENDEKIKDVFVTLDNIDLVIKAFKGEQIDLAEAKEDIEKNLIFKDEKIYKIFDFTNTDLLDNMTKLDAERMSKILLGIIQDVLDKADGFIEYVPRMRFTRLEGWNNFEVVSDIEVFIPDYYPCNNFILPGTKFVVSGDTVQYYWKEKPGNSYNIVSGEQKLDVPMTVEGQNPPPQQAPLVNPNFTVVYGK